jgi:hypothetical protein
MAAVTERIITPAPYTYGKTNGENVLTATVTYTNIAGFVCGQVFENVVRYFISKNGNALTLQVKGVKEKVCKIEWDKEGRIWVSGNGFKEVVKNLKVNIADANGETVVTA